MSTHKTEKARLHHMVTHNDLTNVKASCKAQLIIHSFNHLLTPTAGNFKSILGELCKIYV